jgi:hypothetical protein
MQDWIIIAALYALGIGLFHILGGLGAVADALKDWGTRSSTQDNPTRSST